MKVFVFIFLTTCLLYIQAAPHSAREGRSAGGLSRRQQQLFKEVLCIVKGKTFKECEEDEGLGALAAGLDASVLASYETKPGSADKLLPVPARRDAFYSDWRRRR